MAAIATTILTETTSGDHVVAANDCYGTTVTFLRDDVARFGLTTTLVDVQDLDQVRAAMTARTRLILCEVCTNPLIRVPDLESLAAVAHERGALLVVDNTVPTPALSQPFRWGADVVIHAAAEMVINVGVKAEAAASLCGMVALPLEAMCTAAAPIIGTIACIPTCIGVGIGLMGWVQEQLEGWAAGAIYGAYIQPRLQAVGDKIAGEILGLIDRW